MLNGRFVCTKGYGTYMTQGSIYEFNNGVCELDNGIKSNKYTSVENFNKSCCPQIRKPYPKEMLEVGMVVETREGIRYIVLPKDDGLVIASQDSWNPLKYFNDKLYNGFSELDIMKIYKFNTITLNAMNIDKFLELIWQREEKSPEQIEKERKLEELKNTIKLAQQQVEELEKDMENK